MMNVDKYKKLLLPVFISMSMVACGGGGGSSDAGTTQPPISENQTAVQAMVQSSDGSLLKGVTVSVLDQKAITNENGVAQLRVKIPKGISEVVVKYEVNGFVTQSVLVKTTELKNVTAHMLAAKDIVPVNDIEKAQVIKANSLGATITIPENAFIKPNGHFAQGKVNVYFTPWDIDSNDLNAMPANGFALDTQGNRTQLISAGMITATFVDVETGERLQLAPGKTADIQMNVPFSSINNTKLSEGTKILMWHFDESKGLWVEEGEGEVVKSLESSTGLAVKATVSHFSTWNWDFKISNGGSVFVQCQSAGEPIACNVVANVKLDDKSAFTRSSSIEANGIKITDIPSVGKIEWTAKDLTGALVGQVTSATSGNVIIDLVKPATDNFVKCVLPNDQTTFCTAELNSKYKFSITNEGSKILTDIQDDKLTWSVKSPIFFEDNQWKRYTGTLVSGPKGDLIIQLNEKELLDQNGLAYTMYCSHLENGSFPSSWEAEAQFIGKVCTIQVRVYLNLNTQSEYSELFEFKGLYGKPIEIKLPSEYSGYLHNGTGNVDVIEFKGLLEGTSQIGGFLVEFEDRYPDPNSTQILFFNLN